MEPDEFLQRTGYTPDEFWREAQRPNTITPHRPQLELSLGAITSFSSAPVQPNA